MSAVRRRLAQAAHNRLCGMCPEIFQFTIKVNLEGEIDAEDDVKQ